MDNKIANASGLALSTTHNHQKLPDQILQFQVLPHAVIPPFSAYDTRSISCYKTALCWAAAWSSYCFTHFKKKKWKQNTHTA